MITFDERGYVYPYEVIEITLEEFRRTFVEDLENQDYRAKLFAKYLQFNNDLKKAVGIPYFQWMDGSFTTKKPFPGDIDVVTFIDYDHLVKNARIIHHFSENSQKLYNVDAHFAVTCAWKHRYHERALKDELQWKKIFGFSRADDFG
ncbi:MAG: hypothetical protein IPN76_30465 [Saprospiraceae bacterium]|nr:hypothetical protein [Saprospiraceae bacterium]